MHAFHTRTLHIDAGAIELAHALRRVVAVTRDGAKELPVLEHKRAAFRVGVVLQLHKAGRIESLQRKSGCQRCLIGANESALAVCNVLLGYLVPIRNVMWQHVRVDVDLRFGACCRLPSEHAVALHSAVYLLRTSFDLMERINT